MCHSPREMYTRRRKSSRYKHIDLSGQNTFFFEVKICGGYE